MTTKIWRIQERPEFSIEETPGLWVIWGPCKLNPDEKTAHSEECSFCGGTQERILATCGKDEFRGPVEPNLIRDITGLEHFTPIREYPREHRGRRNNVDIESILEQIETNLRIKRAGD